MSCETNYAKLEKQIPEILQVKTSTGYGNLNLLLRIRAANFWHESLTTLTEPQLHSYCRHMIDFNYPHLKTVANDLYKELTFDDSVETDMTKIYNYQWWLCYVTGPQSCSRDIAYFCTLLNITPNEDWNDELEAAILTAQRSEAFSPYIEVPTGYGCAETLKRLRLAELAAQQN